MFALQAHAVVVSVTVPDDNIARTRELCEELRIQLRVRSAEWSDSKCVSELTRLGALALEHKVRKHDAETAIAGTVTQHVNTYTSTWPPPDKATCPDGTVDTEAPFFEVCDDGNMIDDDACNNSCGR
jgi:cysteine-rich repeat protein